MIGEILTGVFAGLTAGYLFTRHRHTQKKEEEGGRVQPPTGAASHPDHWWSRFPISEEIKETAVKLPTNKKEWDSAALHKIYPPPEKMREISSKLADLDRHLAQVEATHKEQGEQEKMRDEQYKKAYLQYIGANNSPTGNKK